MELLFANSTVKDLAFSQLNTQHGALGETCTDMRTNVDRLDSTSQSLSYEVTALGRRSHRQENDVNQLANDMKGERLRHLMRVKNDIVLTDDKLPNNVTHYT